MIRKLIGIVVGLVVIGWFIKPGNATLLGHTARHLSDAISQLVTALLS